MRRRAAARVIAVMLGLLAPFAALEVVVRASPTLSRQAQNGREQAALASRFASVAEPAPPGSGPLVAAAWRW